LDTVSKSFSCPVVGGLNLPKAIVKVPFVFSTSGGSNTTGALGSFCGSCSGAALVCAGSSGAAGDAEVDDDKFFSLSVCAGSCFPIL
jgi:hypothetical protein